MSMRHAIGSRHSRRSARGWGCYQAAVLSCGTSGPLQRVGHIQVAVIGPDEGPECLTLQDSCTITSRRLDPLK